MPVASPLKHHCHFPSLTKQNAHVECARIAIFANRTASQIVYYIAREFSVLKGTPGAKNT